MECLIVMLKVKKVTSLVTGASNMRIWSRYNLFVVTKVTTLTPYHVDKFVIFVSTVNKL